MVFTKAEGMGRRAKPASAIFARPALARVPSGTFYKHPRSQTYCQNPFLFVSQTRYSSWEIPLHAGELPILLDSTSIWQPLFLCC